MSVIRQNAPSWNVDPGAVAVCGFSAGGLLALLAAARMDGHVDGVFAINASLRLRDIPPDDLMPEQSGYMAATESRP